MSVQVFLYYLEYKSGLAIVGLRALKQYSGDMYENIRFTLRKEGFSYLPPFNTTLDARNLDFTIYRNIIQDAKKSGEYDFIIVDVEAGYSRWRIQLLQDSDKVMLITLQDEVSTNKMRYITQCLDFGDSEKYMVICNKSCYTLSKRRFSIPEAERTYLGQRKRRRPERNLYPRGRKNVSRVESHKKSGRISLPQRRE